MNAVRSWLGLPERIVVLSQILILFIYFGVYSARFTQFSANVDYEMDLEEIIAMVAISTFLVGFSSVRLQSILEERKDGEARKIDRILEQNAGKDLLPLPTTLVEMKTTKDLSFRDQVTSITSCLIWINFFVAFLLIRLHEATSDISSFPFWLVQVVHLGIVLIGFAGPRIVKLQFTEFSKKQPFECYEKMMIEIEKNLKSDPNKESLQEKIEKFDASVPEWSWLTLIRCSFPLNEKNNPQLKRIYHLVESQKDADDYSLIAFVWSAYLLDNPENSIARNVQCSDIEKILKFGEPNSPTNESGDSCVLTDIEPEERLEELDKFLRKTFLKYADYKDTRNFTEVRAINAQIFARLTVREIQRVWRG